MPANVATPTMSYTRQATRWQMLEDLDGGTEAMIRAAQRWLPKEQAEPVKNYEFRLNRSVLYPMFADTLDTGVGRMFSKPVEVKESDALSDRLAELEDDADMAGTSLTQFGREIAHDGMKYGRLHFLVDFPATNATANLRDEQASGVRPYFAIVSPTDLIGWKTRRGENGKQILAQIRVKEIRTEEDGEYGEKEVKSIRVYTDDGEGARWELFSESDKGEYVSVDSGTLSIGYIPLVTAYYDYIAPFESNPPYEGLAWQNIRHWRSSSEQDNLLRVARVPILTGSGLKQEDIDRGVEIGASKILASTSPDAKWSYTEHSGAAIGAGREDLKDIELRAETLGMAPMTQRSGSVTATATAIDESKSSSDLEAWARVTEAAIRQGYMIAAEWIGEELHEEFGIDISTGSDMLLVDQGALTELGAARTRGDITRATYLDGLKSRRILPKDLDVQAEADAAENDQPLGLMSDPAGSAALKAGADDDDEEGSGAGEAA